MWEGVFCGFTTPHHVDEARNKLQKQSLLSTNDAHRSELTRRNIGTCAFFEHPYIDVTRVEGKGWDLASQQRLRLESERKFRGGRRRNQGLRRSMIREQAHRVGQTRPVACLVHVEMVPRRAVRRIGPRPDLTRS